MPSPGVIGARVVPFCTDKLRCPTVWSTDHTEGQALKQRTGTSGIDVLQFLALHLPSNGPWTKWPLPERTMSRDGEQQQESTWCRSFLDPNKGSEAQLGLGAGLYAKAQRYIWAIEQTRPSVRLGSQLVQLGSGLKS
ncbi:hypothetical protein LOK49_LG03G01280 [Camellia lanceoleosa]|uniref:Uncharacterized protein n=1 Tax=Camellia lanceoleosa TaxID=1840588 RepID=A0ACC0IG64_9ERIC|nr:hypothetical protein LOK49_LG03G01280 [Camellia lanceoleosa]